MAQVDFSNAQINAVTNKPWRNSYLYFNYTSSLCNSRNTTITNHSNVTKVSDIASQTSFVYSGEFLESGTEFYIGDIYGWKVTGISFSAGDTYSFQIDIEVSVV